MGNARTVVNIGAGTGSYEPPGRNREIIGLSEMDLGARLLIA